MMSTSTSTPAPSTPSSITAVFFDFGGVFIDSPFAVAGAAAKKFGVDEDTFIGTIFGPYGTDSDHPWHQLERGEMSFTDACEAISGLAVASGIGELNPMDALAELANGHAVRGFMVDAVKGLREKGVATGIITNNIAEFGTAWRAMIPVEELFDDIVDSSSVGVRKPAPEIYRLACERLGVEPGNAAFIDDFQGNVDGAAAIGMRAVCSGFTVETSKVALQHLMDIVSGKA